jgi:hypothetical protein
VHVYLCSISDVIYKKTKRMLTHKQIDIATHGRHIDRSHAAGTLAITRQYMIDGFYPSGERTEADSFVPMGSLLKAVLINSAVGMTGSYFHPDDFPEADVDLLSKMSIPSFEYGFGLIKLDNTLLLKGYNMGGRSLYMDGNFNDMPKVDFWKAVKYTFKAPENGGNFKVTLVWADAPGTVAARVALVNDLDLEVYDSEGIQYFPNNLNSRDNINNVEQVIVSGLKGKFTVRVVGKAVPLGPQPYALVVHGNSFEMIGEKAEERIMKGEVVGSIDDEYFSAWLAGGLVMGGMLLLGGDKYVSKKRLATDVRPASSKPEIVKEQSVANPKFDADMSFNSVE